MNISLFVYPFSNQWEFLLFPAIMLLKLSHACLSLGIYTHCSWVQNMWRFNLIRKCHTLFQNGCITLHSHQRCMSDPVTPNSFVDCHGCSFIFTILVGIKWYHLVLKWIFLCACWLFMHPLLSIIQSCCPSL